MLQEEFKILEKFSDRFSQLLNVPGDLDDAAKDKIEQRPLVPRLNDAPDINELI